MKYRQQYEGEWFRPRQTGWRMACCDCLLVHVVNFRIVANKVELQVHRDNRATGQRRRGRKGQGQGPR